MLSYIFQKSDAAADGIRQTVDLSFCYVKFSPQGIILDCNQNFSRLFHIDHLEEVKGKHHRIFVDEEFSGSQAYKDFWSDLSTGKTQSGEFHRKNLSGEDVYIQAAYTPIKDKSGKVEFIVKIASDITETKINSNRSDAIKNAIDQSMAFIQFDTNGIILDANENFVGVMGFENKDELLMKHHSMFVETSYAKSEDYVHFWKDLRNGQVNEGQFQRIRKDGRRVWLQASYSPVKDGFGNVQSVIKIARDITEQKEISQKAHDIKSTIDLSFGYIQFDSEGIIQDLNENFARLMGYGTGELVGKHHSKFVSPDHAQSTEYFGFWQQLRAGNTISGEFQRMAKDRSEVWIQASYTPIKDDAGEVISVMKIAADISKTKHAAINAKKELKQEALVGLSEISSAINEIANGAKNQAQLTDQSSEKIETVLSSSKQMAVVAEQIELASSEGVSNSIEGDTMVSDMVSTMQILSEMAGKTQGNMSSLVNRITEISNILKVIQDIAAQTNLLALNAAIEAAQAGEAGRGFAIIAKEVRNLAENSKNSTKEIEEMIMGIQTDTTKVSEDLKSVTNGVDLSSDKSEKVKNIFRKMSESSKATSSLSKEIVDAANYQVKEIQSVVGNIENIVIVAEETAAGSEEVAAATKGLEEEMGKY